MVGNVVVIEDDPSISELLQLYLGREGYEVHASALGADGVELVRRHDPSLVVLDLMLPDGSGFDFLKSIREFSQASLIILTARDAEQDKILGLELGADDYMVKPFSPGELVARARAVQRRASAQGDAATQAQVLGDLQVLPAERTVRLGGAAIDLTPKEFDLLHYLLVNRGLALTRERLLEEVWGYTSYGDARTVDVHIGQLRKKLGESGEMIQTVWGLGYRVDPGELSMRASIRRRLVLALAGVSLFSVVVVGAVFYLFLGGYVIERQKDLLLDQAVGVAEQLQGVSGSLPTMGTDGMHGRGMMLTALLRADLRVLPTGSGIAVFTDSGVLGSAGAVPVKAEALGNLRTQAERLEEAGLGPTASVVDIELNRAGSQVAAIVAVASFELADSTAGLVVVTLARADAFNYRSGIVRTLLIAGGIAVALAVAVGLGLGAWMTRPLRRLSVAARGIAGGSYEQPVTGSYPGEIQQLADDLESMRQEVRRSEDSLRGFVSSAAHELRTPLTSIQGFSQALLDGTAVTGEERSRSAAAIYRESTRLRRLVDSLLILSRYDSHEFQPNLVPVSVEEIVREEAERLLQTGSVEAGRIELRVEGESVTVTDGDMLRQVVANLLHNAVQYGEGGRVEVYLRQSGEHLLLDVANGGPPLLAEDRSRLFSRFYRGRAGRKTEGFGLGLALVWEICGLLGGKVELVDGDAATRFRVTLPLVGKPAAGGEGSR